MASGVEWLLSCLSQLPVGMWHNEVVYCVLNKLTPSQGTYCPIDLWFVQTCCVVTAI